MKTPPVQQKQVAKSGQDAPRTEAEGKSVAPPAFQLKTSDGNATSPASGAGAQTQALQRKAEFEEGEKGTAQNAPQLLTIIDKNAALREGPPSFKPLKTKIPRGTRVEVLEESVVKRQTYIRVKDHDSGAELGWTSKGNSKDLDAKYKAAGATYTYHVDGHDLLVFLPKDGLKTQNPNVFMFFHGRGGDYATTKTHTPGTSEFADNPAISGKIPDAVSNSGGIAICPQGHGFKVDGDWGSIGAGGFQKMASTALGHLSKDLGMEDKPLTAGNVSLAGHSAGGNALGQAALDTGATDVTMQEAGYGFENSWGKLRDWFLQGQGPKTMRVITQGNSKGESTRKPVREAATRKGKVIGKGAQLSSTEIVAYSKKLTKEGLLPGPVTVQEFQGDGKVEDGNIIMERGYRVFKSDGSLQGSMRLYHLADPTADHWAAATETMATSMTSGAKDRAADQEATK